MEEEAIKFPTGRYEKPTNFAATDTSAIIDLIKVTPRWLDACVENLDASQLHTPYRQGGWTINQIIHHLADVNMNMFVRTKLALTEEVPVIKPFEEDDWAITSEIAAVPFNYSLTLLHALHFRWAALMEHMSESQWQRTFIHPQRNERVHIWEMLHYVAWHGRHHAEQIFQTRIRNNW